MLRRDEAVSARGAPAFAFASRHLLQTGHTVRVSTCAARVGPRYLGRQRFACRLGKLRASGPFPDGPENPISPDDQPDGSDSALLESLRWRVRDLYGSEEAPVAGRVPPTKDSALEAPLRRERGGRTVRTYVRAQQERSQALFVVGSIFFLSILSGVLFVFIYGAGAVHGGGHSVQHKPPIYGTDSYVNPYELLESSSSFDQ
jgi:hypothetical protein